MKPIVAERKWNSRVNDELNTWSYIHKEKPKGIIKGVSDDVPVTPILDFGDIPNAKCRESILNVMNRINKGRDDEFVYIEAAVTQDKVVAVRVFIRNISNQGAIIGGGCVYSIWNEDLFNDYFFDKVYRKSFNMKC